MVKHIKKSYSKDGKLTDREKSIAYATAWKHHNKEEVDNTFVKKRGEQLTPEQRAKANADYKQRARDEIKRRTAEKRAQREETEHTTHAKDVVKVGKDTIKIPKSAKKDLDKISKARDKNWWHHQDKAMSEDARYKAAMGPGSMEWGTDVGDNYFRDLTPGQSPKNKLAPLKPLNIKARKPEDEKGTKITEEMTSAEKSKHEYPINNEKETFDKGDEGHWLTGKDGDWYIETPDVDYLDKEAENYTFDQAVEDGLYDDDELEWEDFDNTPGFDNEIDVTEALSVQGRLKRRFNARRNKQKLKVARRIALRRGSTPDRLKKRATRGARLMVYKRLLRGRDRAGLPPAEKARLERMIQRFQPLVSRISVKLLPQMRRNEIKRLTSAGKMKAKTSKKFKPAKPVRSASQKKTKKFKIKKMTKYKPKKPKKVKPRYASGGPTIKKASKAYKAFSYSVG